MSFTLFATRKNQINNAIATIQGQIAQLQQQLADQQVFLQEIGTVEQAGESALNQTQTFLSMIRAIDPSQESIFWQAMDALKNQSVDLIAPVSEIEEKEEVSPTLDVSTEDVTDTIEAIAVTVEETQEPEQPQSDDTQEVIETLEETEEEEATQPALLTISDISRISWTDLKNICAKKNISNPSGQRLTRKFAEGVLFGTLTTADIAHLAS